MTKLFRWTEKHSNYYGHIFIYEGGRGASMKLRFLLTDKLYGVKRHTIHRGDYCIEEIQI